MTNPVNNLVPSLTKLCIVDQQKVKSKEQLESKEYEAYFNSSPVHEEVDIGIHDYDNVDADFPPNKKDDSDKNSILHHKNRSKYEYQGHNNDRSRSPRKSQSAPPMRRKSLIQYSQKCPICDDWILGGQDIKKYDGDDEDYTDWDCHVNCYN